MLILYKLNAYSANIDYYLINPNILNFQDTLSKLARCSKIHYLILKSLGEFSIEDLKAKIKI